MSPDEQEGVLPTRKKEVRREEGDRAYIVYESTIYSPLDSPLPTPFRRQILAVLGTVCIGSGAGGYGI